MVVVDHFCYQPWKITPAPWGSFRTPHLERIMVDNAIMSMMFKSTATLLTACYYLLNLFSYKVIPFQIC